MSECSEQQQNNAPSNISAASPVQAADEMATSNNTETVTSEPLSSKLNAQQSSPNTDNKKAAAKRTPSKRLSFIERAQKESEELVRNMGGSLELEGGRRTRSSTRGTPTRVVVVGTPPPSKKARNSPSSGAATPTRARGKGRKLDTTTDTDDETSTTAPAKKEKPLKMKRGATERKEEEQQNVIKEEEEEEEGKSESKADNTVQKNQLVTTPPVVEDDKKVKDLEAVPATQSTEDEPDAVLDPVPEETESQTNDDLLDESQLKVDAQEQSTVAVEQKLPPSSAALTNETESEQQLEATTTAAAVAVNKTKAVDLTEEEEEENTTKNIPKTIDCMTNNVEPMEVDSSSKSNDAVQVIESDNNSAEVDKANTISYETPKAIDKSPENVVALNAVAELKTKEPSDNTVPDTNTNTNTSTTNAIIIDNKAVGDSEMNNCTSLNEHKTNNTDKDISATEMVETSAPAITAANNTNATTPPSI